MSIPLRLTLAIVDGVSIALDETFNIPLSYGTESPQPSRGDIKSISGQRVMQVRAGAPLMVGVHKSFKIKPKVTDIRAGNSGDQR